MGLWISVVVSALTFVLIVPKPVFDDAANLQDVSRYARDGVSVIAVERQVNPAGPLSYIVIGLGGSFLGGALWSFRVVNAICCCVLGAALFWIARRRTEVLAMACLIVVSPYMALASATILTEMPSLLALTVGVLCWLHGLADVSARRGKSVRTELQTTAELVIGGGLIGIAITGRQYYLAALPAMAITAVTCWRGKTEDLQWSAIARVLASSVVAVLPVLVLFAIWGGLTPPNMQSNISYSNTTATVGVNLVRPVTAALLIGIYTLPVLILQRDLAVAALVRLVPWLATLAFVINILVPRDYLWCPPDHSGCGPIGDLHNVAYAMSPYLGIAFDGVASVLGLSGLLLLLRAVRSERSDRGELLAVSFAKWFVTFFVVEQFLVGGNIPFYDRYILQIAPVLGLAVANKQRFSIKRALLGSVPLILLGQYRLWKYLNLG